jgi:hypothetical protein
LNHARVDGGLTRTKKFWEEADPCMKFVPHIFVDEQEERRVTEYEDFI